MIAFDRHCFAERRVRHLSEPVRSVDPWQGFTGRGVGRDSLKFYSLDLTFLNEGKVLDFPGPHAQGFSAVFITALFSSAFSSTPPSQERVYYPSPQGVVTKDPDIVPRTQKPVCIYYQNFETGVINDFILFISRLAR